MDPVSGIIGLLGGSEFIGVGNTIVRRFVSDKASIESLKLRREELQRADERFRIQLDERRNELRNQFEKQIQIGAIVAQLQRKSRREDCQAQKDIRREEWPINCWPLSILPNDFMTASKTCGGYATNIIVKVAPGAAKARSSARLEAEIALNSGPMEALERLFSGHQSRVLLYNETRIQSRQTERSLTVSLWSMLHTEPTILVEVDTSASGNYILRVSFWGASTQSNDILVASLDDPHPSQIFARLGTVHLARSPQPQERGVALSFQLALAVSLLVDALAILQRPQELAAPIFGTLLGDSHVKSLPPEVWRPLGKTFESIYDLVAIHSPVVAAESAAVYALSLDAVGQRALAEGLLDAALKYFRGVIREPAASAGRILEMLVRSRGNSEPSALERAMLSIWWTTIPSPRVYPDLAKLLKMLDPDEKRLG